MNRKHFLDNIRWVTVLLVLLYHVVYFYNNKGVFISSRYALQKSSLFCGCSHTVATTKQWFKKRTRQLLVPATIGLFVFQWMTGYFNTQIAGVAQGIPNQIASIPAGPIRYMACAFSGIGPLWFIQELWVFSLLLIIIIAIERDRLYNAVGRLLQSTRGWSKPCRLALLLVVWRSCWWSVSSLFGQGHRAPSPTPPSTAHKGCGTSTVRLPISSPSSWAIISSRATTCSVSCHAMLTGCLYRRLLRVWH